MTKPEQVGVSAWRNAETATFWHWAEAERDRAPETVVPLIDREKRQIIVTYEQAVEIAAWATDHIGWEPTHTKPLRFSDRDTGETIDPPT